MRARSSAHLAPGWHTSKSDFSANPASVQFRVLARLCDDSGGGVAALRRTTGEEAKRRQVPEMLARLYG